ncbi:MAG: hypothetical protein COX57_13615 [Alphaproteobacteria bacterium CG_4_10_14_0_2_um_filter_63_37]|nr:MAG: hypothetical protein COX57_13615 [Alphaproteobacteria bacterium CG_4_10_14_0_2_um_filter_63_37]
MSPHPTPTKILPLGFHRVHTGVGLNMNVWGLRALGVMAVLGALAAPAWGAQQWGVQPQAAGLSASGLLNMSWQRPHFNQTTAGGEGGSISGDLFLGWGTTSEKVAAHLEWAAGNGICGLYNGSCTNADLRTTTQGFQVSEIYWSFLQGASILEIGMIDSTRWIDINPLAGDENRLFMGQPFRLDPTIPHPDYAPGGVIQTTDIGWAVTLLGASSMGLIDANGDPNAVWDAAGKVGNFFALSLGSTSPVGTRITYWQDNGHYAAGSGVSHYNDGNRTHMARGVSLSAATGTPETGGGYFVRLGWGDQQQSRIGKFASLGVVMPSGAGLMGLGWAGSWLSRGFLDHQAAIPAGEQVNAGAAEHHVEWFYRVQAGAQSEWTLDLQYLRHPGGDSQPNSPARRQDWIGGMRLVSLF